MTRKIHSPSWKVRLSAIKMKPILIGVSVFMIVMAFLIARSFIYNNYSVPVILIPGGGLTNDGKVPNHVQLRLNKAFELYEKLKDRYCIIITLSGGTTHKPNPLNDQGFPISEATASILKLIEMGIPSTNLYEELFSLDTIGNVRSITFHRLHYFSLYMIHVNKIFV